MLKNFAVTLENNDLISWRRKLGSKVGGLVDHDLFHWCDLKMSEHTIPLISIRSEKVWYSYCLVLFYISFSPDAQCPGALSSFSGSINYVMLGDGAFNLPDIQNQLQLSSSPPVAGDPFAVRDQHNEIRWHRSRTTSHQVSPM